MKIEWKVINDSDGHYFISNNGIMRRESYYFITKANKKCFREEKIYQPIFNKQNGYYNYKYRGYNGQSITKNVHRLVAEHFVKNSNNSYNEINHIDGNKGNNVFTNLEWTNRKLNMIHASVNNLINRNSEKRKIQCAINSKKGIHKLFKSVAEYDNNGFLINVYDSYNKINHDTLACKRLSRQNKYYREVDILKSKYGEIPNKINVDRIKNINNNKRKKYISTDENNTIHCYNRLKDLPISREELWYCFNHQIKDKNNRYWDIVNI